MRLLIAVWIIAIVAMAWPAGVSASWHARIGGFKVYDCNGDAHRNAKSCAGGTSEPGISGWNIYLFAGSCDTMADDLHPIAATETAANGVTSGPPTSSTTSRPS